MPARKKQVDGLFEGFDHLGFIQPYWFDSEQVREVDRDFAALIRRRPEPSTIDPAGVVEIISRYFFFADRTVIQGVSRAPWMARPDAAGRGGWEYADVPAHGSQMLPVEQAAQSLFDRVQREAA